MSSAEQSKPWSLRHANNALAWSQPSSIPQGSQQMAPIAPPGEPREGSKPQPIGDTAFIILLPLCMLCAVFILWRRASSLRTVVGHRLQTWTGREGTIRLSLDDGPSAREFLDDDYDGDNERLPDDDEPLALRAQHLKTVSPSNSRSPGDADDGGVDNRPLTPPPKT